MFGLKTQLCICLFALVFIKSNCGSEQKLTVHLLYESLCPDSIKFIKDQLYPAWKHLAPYINIVFVPFGKSASLLNGAKFVCQHGPKECLGNRIQSCVLSAIEDQNLQVEYVHCFMNLFKKSHHDKKELGQRCASQVGVNWDHVRTCHDSSMGTALQLEAEQITAKIGPKFIPTVLFNGEFHQEAQDDSQVNFHAVACSLIHKFYPNAC